MFGLCLWNDHNLSLQLVIDRCAPQGPCEMLMLDCQMYCGLGDNRSAEAPAVTVSGFGD